GSIDVVAGDAVRVGQPVVVLESMKMEHVVAAQYAGTVTRVAVEVGETVMEGDALVLVEPGDVGVAAGASQGDTIDLDAVRADLAEAIGRHDVGLDDRRPDAVARRR